MPDGYDTAEEAALSGWAPTAEAFVVRTEYESDDVVYVFVDSVPSHPMKVTCERRAAGWLAVSDVSD